jgi:hypothetical protein
VLESEAPEKSIAPSAAAAHESSLAVTGSAARSQEDKRASVDLLNGAGASMLTSLIRDFWAAMGFSVKVDVVPMPGSAALILDPSRP